MGRTKYTYYRCKSLVLKAIIYAHRKLHPVIRYIKRLPPIRWLGRSRRRMSAALMAVLLVFSLAAINLYNPVPAEAKVGTATVWPNGDYGTTNNWAELSASPDTSCTGGTHCDHVDEDNEADYLGTGLSMNATTAEEEFDFETPSVAGTLYRVTAVTVTINANVVTACQGGGANCDHLNVRLFIDGAYNGTTRSTSTLTTGAVDYQVTWTGLTASTATDLRVEVVRVANGTGGTSANDDNVRMSDIRAALTFNYIPSQPVLTQEDYIFENDDYNGGIDAPDPLVDGPVTITSAASYGQIFKAADGDLYSFVTNGAACEIWKSSNGGTSWSEQDSANNPTSCTRPDAAIDSAGVIHYVYDNGTNAILYNTFASSTDTFSTAATIRSSPDNAEDSSIAIDSNNIPHVIWSDLEFNGITYDARILYLNRIGGTWGTLRTVYGVSNGGIVITGGNDLTINEDNIPEATFVDDTVSATLYAAVGNANNSTSFSTQSLDSSLVGSGVINVDASGNTYVLYKDENGASDYVSVLKNDDAAGWGTWNAVTNNTNVGFAYTLAFDNDTAIALYIDENSDIVFDTYDGTWGGETVLLAGAYTTASIRFAKHHMVDPGSFDIVFIESGSARWALMDASAQLPASAQAGSLFTSPKTLDNMRIGERSTLRMHVKNTGTGGLTSDNELGLFYDRNGDGIWRKVSNYMKAATAAGDCTGSTDFECTVIDATDQVGFYSSVAIDSSGKPWVVYNDGTNGNLEVAHYVGSGGDCDTVGGGSDEWECTTIDATSTVGSYASIAIDNNNRPWVAYQDVTNQTLEVANFVGSGGDCDTTGAGSDAWECTIVDAPALKDVGRFADIGISPSGDVWVAHHNFTDADLRVSTYVGSGGNCDSGALGSDAWNCTAVITTGGAGTHSAVGFDASDTPWVSTYDSTNGNLVVAKYVGSGGTGCNSTAWQCTTVDATDTVGNSTSVATAPDGNVWISYTDTTNNNLELARYVGSGGNCDTVGAGSDAWECTTVDATGIVGGNSELAFDPSGRAWVSYSDSTNADLRIARYVGSGGNCDTVGGGSDAWECITVDSTGNVGTTSQVSFDPLGRPWIVFTDDTNDNLKIATAARYGEILAAPSQSFTNRTTLWESHADMTSATDSANRDSGDCVSGSTIWNKGSHFNGEAGIGAEMPAGNSTAQCTEVAWTIDTSQATAGATYRFVVATRDSLDRSSSTWRGPAQIDEYPTIVISEDFEQSIRYSKTSNLVLADCTNTAWGCMVVDNDTDNTGQYSDVAISPDGIPYISYYDATAGALMLAQYVGNGGIGCGASGSSAWSCSVIKSGSTDGLYTSIAFDRAGNPWISYNSNNGNGDLWVAKYVGNGGTGCTSSAWTCDDVRVSSLVGQNTDIMFDANNKAWIAFYSESSMYIMRQNDMDTGNCPNSTSWDCEDISNPSNTTGFQPSLALGPTGFPWVSFYDSTATALTVAQYVGGGNGSGCGTAQLLNWVCTTVDNDTDNTGQYSSIAFNSSGVPTVVYNDATATSLMQAVYVGTGGTGCGASGSSAWTCTVIDNDTDNTGGNYNRLAFDPAGNAVVTYHDATAVSLMVARFVSSGGSGCGASGSSAWSCTTVDETSASVGQQSALTIDESGAPWISYYDTTNTSLRVAKLDLPTNRLGNTRPSFAIPSGDYTYSLTSGRSSYAQTGVDCAGNRGQSGYCGLNADNGDYDGLYATGSHMMPLYGLAAKFSANSTAPTLLWVGNSNLAPNTASSSGDIVMEIYRFGSTNAWEEVKRDSSSSGCSLQNCVMTGMPSGTASEYYENIGGSYWAYVRIYQVTDSSTLIDFRVDAFSFIGGSSQLSSGSFFRDGERLPLNLMR